jgi:hypothetical protein
MFISELMLVLPEEKDKFTTAKPEEISSLIVNISFAIGKQNLLE